MLIEGPQTVYQRFYNHKIPPASYSTIHRSLDSPGLDVETNKCHSSDTFTSINTFGQHAVCQQAEVCDELLCIKHPHLKWSTCHYICRRLWSTRLFSDMSHYRRLSSCRQALAIVPASCVLSPGNRFGTLTIPGASTLVAPRWWLHACASSWRLHARRLSKLRLVNNCCQLK
jgi:hypothetical protein